MERLINLHKQFGSFNCTISSEEVSDLIATKIQLYSSQHSDQTETSDLFDFDDFQGGPNNDSESCRSCDHWTCTNDFIFAVLLIINLCELHNMYKVEATSTVNLSLHAL